MKMIQANPLLMQIIRNNDWNIKLLRSNLTQIKQTATTTMFFTTHKILSTLGATTMLVLSVIAHSDNALIIDQASINPTVPGMQVTGAYMHIMNKSNEEISLVRASSPLSDRIELHEHTTNNGLMKMQEVTSIAIPANGHLTLKPGGYHIMIMNLKETVTKGKEHILTLEFSNGHKKTIAIIAQKPKIIRQDSMYKDKHHKHN